MKILVLGGTGMLGHKLIQLLSNKFDVYATIKLPVDSFSKYKILDKSNIFGGVNIEEFEKISLIIADIKPDVVINAVGIIKQVKDGKDLQKLNSVNSIFPQRLARVAEKFGFKLITISTDCVFSGSKGKYVETSLSDADDYYGQSKFLGEVFGKNCLTLRTSIIGRELLSQHSLVEWFLSQKGSIKGYTNAIYSGFPTIVLADILAALIADFPNLNGLYHVSSEPISKYDLLHLCREQFNSNIDIEPFDEFYLDRSLDSTKFRTETGFKPLDWKEMVRLMADDPTPYEEWRNGIF